MLLILHGWGHNKKMWQPVIDKLGDEIEVQALDFPGFGQEPLISKDWKIEDYANWVDAKINENKWTDITLLGHSMGGQIASVLASRNPNYLKKLILFAANPLYRPSFMIKIKVLATRILKPFLPSKAKYKLIKNEEYKEAMSRGLKQFFVQSVTSDFTEELKKITISTYLIWGQNDREVPLKIAEEMEELIPNSKLVIMPNLGHNAYLENTTLFVGILKKILQNKNDKAF